MYSTVSLQIVFIKLLSLMQTSKYPLSINEWMQVWNDNLIMKSFDLQQDIMLCTQLVNTVLKQKTHYNLLQQKYFHKLQKVCKRYLW